MSKPSRPALRYHGGKWRLAPWIISHFPGHRVYVEPFGGGASVLLRKPPAEREVYNDLDEDVVNLFRVLRDPVSSDRLIELLKLTPFSRTEFEDSYEPTSDAVERARRLAVRSYMGFGSSVFANHATGFRDYTKIHRNDRFPARDWVNYPPCLSTIVERLRGVVVDRRSALEVIPRHDSPATLYYVDPPYVLSTRSNNRGVRQKYEHELTDADHTALAELLRAVEGFVVVSGYDCELYAGLYSGWRRSDRQAMADGANPRLESLWINPACDAALPRSAEWCRMKRSPIPRLGKRKMEKLGGKPIFSTITAPRKAVRKKPRSKSEFQRIYGSKERVLFVKGLPCCACGVVGYSENAHIETGGTGRKADYTKIVALCGMRFWRTSTSSNWSAGCHSVLHQWGRAMFENTKGIDLEKCAEATEKLWLAHTEEGK